MRLERKQFSYLFVYWATIGLLVGHRLEAQAPAKPIVIDLRTEAVRQTTVQLLTERSVQAKQAAETQSKQRGWQIRGELPGGRVFELMEVQAGRPRYYITANANAAISTAANRIRNTAPYNVNGAGYTVGIWDGGAVRSTHQEFGARVLIMDGATVADHATHVGGTIGASGVVVAARGMAPNVSIDSYEWTSDIAEMTSRAATGPGQAGKIHLSNHSYGFASGWESGSYSGNNGPHHFGTAGEREDRSFGQYSSTAVSWDALHYNGSYYLAFKSVGNDRNDAAPATGTTYYYYSGGWLSKAYDPATDPYADGWDQGGYDTMEEEACAKNIMTVGAVNDAVSGGVRVSANGTMSTFSGWGPTDDGRIKPDIVANGINLYSSIGTSDTSYDGTYSGTSMATPNAAGTAALLVEYYGNRFPGQAMRASTLKGLIIHTADDLGATGPDYAYGWGLVNAEAAANQIKAHAETPSGLYLYEGLLTVEKPNESFTFRWDGISPIRTTICWTDPAGTAQSGLDDRTAVLVNDLDLRIAGPGGTPVYYPYVLNVNNPTSAATTGDNVVDNVEQIRIAAPSAGIYTVTVSHKGTLSGGQQSYSLILSGQYSDVDDSGLTPASGFEPTGLVGGPFSPACATYTLTNQGSVPLSWTAAKTQAWLDVTPTNGVLFANSSTNVSVCLNPVANGLAAGTYYDSVTFSNATIGVSQARSVSLFINNDQVPLCIIDAGSTVTEVTINATGTALDDTKVQQVLVRVNGGEWQQAVVTGTTIATWSADVTLTAAGDNTVEAKAVDSSAHESSVVSTTYVLQIAGTLSVLTDGNGSTTSAPSPAYIGVNYTMTATPGANWLFKDWTASVDGGAFGVVATTRAYTFTMPTNLTLTANFVSNGFAAAAGVYNGLVLGQAGVAHQSSGFITLKTTSKQMFSGKVLVDGNKVGFSGVLAADGTGTSLLKPGKNNRVNFGKTPLYVTVALGLAGSDQITGTVYDDPRTWTSDYVAYKAVYSQEIPATDFADPVAAGQYTLVIPGTNAVGSPKGDSYAVVTVGLDGKVKAKGGLAEGMFGKPGKAEKLKSVVCGIAADGTWPFYAPAYKDALKEYQGSVMGWMKFNGAAVHTNRELEDASVVWIKTAGAADSGYYDAGFTNLIDALGSVYVLSGAGVRPLEPVPGGTATVDHTDGNLVLSFSNTYTWLNSDPFVLANKDKMNPPLNEEKKISMKDKTGAIKGGFVIGTTKIAEMGVLLQDADVGRGFFLGTSESGAFRLQPD